MNDNSNLEPQSFNTIKNIMDKPTGEAKGLDSLASEAINLAQQQFQHGDVDGAVSTLLNRGIKATPNSPSPYFELVEILIADGRFDDALQVVGEMPPATSSILKSEIKAICYAALGNDEKAQQEAMQASERPRSLVVLGTLAARTGDTATAERYFYRAIEFDPNCGSAWLSLGMLQWGQGQQVNALQAVERSVTVGPLNNEAVRILLDMSGRMNQLTTSVSLISDAVRMYPESRSLAYTHLELLVEIGCDELALAACEAFFVRFGVEGHLLSMALELRKRTGLHDRLAKGEERSISLCMIVKNEEANIMRCLTSLKPVVHEMVVVDTGSSDNTVALATLFGARVVSFPWTSDFSAARNVGINQARGAWILVIDADEVISVNDYKMIRQTVEMSVGKKVCWSVITRNYTHSHPEGWVGNDGSYPNDEIGDGWSPSSKVRLFPNIPQIRFIGEVHEMVDSSALVAGYQAIEASFAVHHYGRLSVDPYGDREKKIAYFELGKQKLANNQDDVPSIAELAIQAAELELYDEALGFWNRVQQLAPNSDKALFNMGYCLMGLKRYSEALVVSKKALEVNPSHKEAAYNYGTCELYVGDPNRAIVLLQPVVERYHDSPLLQALLSVLFMALLQPENARGYVGQLTEKNYDVSGYLAARIQTLESLTSRAQFVSNIKQTVSSLDIK